MSIFCFIIASINNNKIKSEEKKKNTLFFFLNSSTFHPGINGSLCVSDKEEKEGKKFREKTRGKNEYQSKINTHRTEKSGEVKR